MPNPMDTGSALNSSYLYGQETANTGYYQDLSGQWYRSDGTPIRKIDITKPGETGYDSDSIERWARDNDLRLTPETRDILYNQYFNYQDTRSAWERTMSADNTKYQRAVEDMKKAGLNPFLLMSNGASGAGTSSPGSVGSGSISAVRNQNRASDTQMMTSVMQIISTISSAIIMGLLLKK